MDQFVAVTFLNGTAPLTSSGQHRVACVHLAEWLTWFDALQIARGRGHLSLFQTQGNAEASAGTHECGSAWDMSYTGDASLEDARQMGAAAWPRLHALGWPQNKGEHAHGLIDCGDNVCNGFQYTAYLAGFNGLGFAGQGGTDPLAKPDTVRSWQEGIAWAQAQIAGTSEEIDMSGYIFMGVAGGGGIWLLAPGKEPQHLDPQMWALWRRLGAQLKGGDFNATELALVNAQIQPAGSLFSVDEEVMTQRVNDVIALNLQD